MIKSMALFEVNGMTRFLAALLLLTAVGTARAGATQPGHVTLLCHRTANEEVPENTLESLEQAALMGCNVVEIDLRRTLDGKIVLNHDGFLERLTDGVGETEQTYFDDLRLRDVGGWMGNRFEGMQIPLFEDALRLAREKNIELILDMKTKGIGPDVLGLLQREGMLQRVRFGGEWDDVKQLYPKANVGSPEAWVQPGVTSEQVRAHHREGKAVIANFSANGHEMDLAAMKAAVAAGVDGINVDYPRLGADAAGRPVERQLAALAAAADRGESTARVQAILQLARYRGFALQDEFAHWLLDSDDHVSRAAALALVTSRPHPPVSTFAEALRSQHADARANAAWALGMLRAPASEVAPLLKDTDPQVLQEALLAISRMPGDVDAATLLNLLSHGEITFRGEASLALARHHPEIALNAVSEQLQLEVSNARIHYDDYVRRGKPQLTQQEIKQITGYFRCQMKMVQAISMLKSPDAMRTLEKLAFSSKDDFSQMSGLVAGFQLWDRIGMDAESAVEEMGSANGPAADRAEWILIQAGPAALPNVRKALISENSALKQRAIRVLAWHGDEESLPPLRAMLHSDPADADLIVWAIDKIQSLHPNLESTRQP
jgi:HEAT repeat protein